MTVVSEIPLTSLMFKTREYFVFHEVLSQLPMKKAESAIARAKDSPKFTCRFALSKEWVSDDSRKTLAERGFTKKETTKSAAEMVFSDVLIDAERMEGLILESFRKKVVLRVEQLTLQEASLTSAVFKWHFSPRSKRENAIKKTKVTRIERSEGATRVDCSSAKVEDSSKARTSKRPVRQSRLNKECLKRTRPCLSNDNPNPVEAANTGSFESTISEDVMLRPRKRTRQSNKYINYTEPSDFVDLPELQLIDDTEMIDDVELIDDTKIINDTQLIDDTQFLDDTETNDDTEPIDDTEKNYDAEPIDDAEPNDDAETNDNAETNDDAEPIDDTETNDDTEPIDDTETNDDAEPIHDTEPNDDAETNDDAEPIDDTQLIYDTEPTDSSQATDSTKLLDDGKTKKGTVQRKSPSCSNTSPSSYKGSPKKKLVATLPNTTHNTTHNTTQHVSPEMHDFQEEFDMPLSPEFAMVHGTVNFMESLFRECSLVQDFTKNGETSSHGSSEKVDSQSAQGEKLNLPDSTTLNTSTRLGEDLSQENCSEELTKPSGNQNQGMCSEMDDSGSMPCLLVCEDTSDIQEVTAVLPEVTESNIVTTEIQLIDLTKDKTTKHNSKRGTADLANAIKDPVGNSPNISVHQQHNQPKADECQNQIGESSSPDSLIQITEIKTEKMCDETVSCACMGSCNNQEVTDNISVLPEPDKLHNTLCDSTCNLDAHIGNPPNIQEDVCGTKTNQELNTSNSEKVSGKGKSLKY